MRGGLDGLRRQPGTREPRTTVLRHAREVIGDLPHLLVLEQPPDEFRARVFPRVVVLVARQEQLRLDAQEPGRHLQVLCRLVDPERLDPRQELLGDARDRDVVDVDLLVADQREQETKRPLDLLQFDDEGFTRERGCGHPMPIA